jgi:hypothetical protein
MSYSEQIWQDDNPEYPVSAERMTHIEQGIAAAHTIRLQGIYKSVTVDVPYDTTDLYTTGAILYTPTDGEVLLGDTYVDIDLGFNTQNNNGAKARVYFVNPEAYFAEFDIGGILPDVDGSSNQVETIASVQNFGSQGSALRLTDTPLRVVVQAGDNTDPNDPTPITEGSITFHLILLAA